MGHPPCKLTYATQNLEGRDRAFILKARKLLLYTRILLLGLMLAS